MPSLDVIEPWAQFGLVGLVVGALFLLICVLIWAAVRLLTAAQEERAAARTDYRETLDSVVDKHASAIDKMTDERRRSDEQLNATLRELTGIITASNMRR